MYRKCVVPRGYTHESKAVLVHPKVHLGNPRTTGVSGCLEWVAARWSSGSAASRHAAHAAEWTATAGAEMEAASAATATAHTTSHAAEHLHDCDYC